MKQTIPKNDSPIVLESKVERRTEIVPAIKSLTNPIDAITSFGGNLNREKHPKEDMRSTFESADNPLIAIAKCKDFLLSQSSVTRAHPNKDVGDTPFGRDWQQYSKREAAADYIEARLDGLNQECASARSISP